YRTMPNVRMRLLWVVLAVFPPSAAGASCEELAALRLKNVAITSAQTVDGGCHVAATLKPTSDSEIKIAVWMPPGEWNGKFLANGNGGWSGSINPSTLGAGIRRGYATAMTDTGHE